jgi:hypothetical protein
VGQVWLATIGIAVLFLALPPGGGVTTACVTAGNGPPPHETPGSPKKMHDSPCLSPEELRADYYRELSRGEMF